MKISYETKDVCSSKIELTIENDIIKGVEFKNGCKGNLSAVSVLVEGMNTKEAVAKLKGIKCGARETSCPDQLAKAIEQAVAAH